MYQWTRKDFVNVRLALIIGLPFLVLIALRAFGDEGTTLSRILAGAALIAWAALLLKWLHVRRVLARDGGRAEAGQ